MKGTITLTIEKMNGIKVNKKMESYEAEKNAFERSVMPKLLEMTQMIIKQYFKQWRRGAIKVNVTTEVTD